MIAFDLMNFDLLSLLKASCLYVSGAWKCVCEDGYTGDGEVCYGNVGQVSTSYLIAKTGSYICLWIRGLTYLH